MDISFEKLSQLASEAYDRGAGGCVDMKQQDIEEVLNKFQAYEQEEFRVWKAEELKRMPEGTVFYHMLRKHCFITSRANGCKFMRFKNGQEVSFNSDSEPWDIPMRLVYSSER